MQIKASDATQVNGAYFGNLYDAEAGIRFRYIPGQMVEHGSAEHKRLEGRRHRAHAAGDQAPLRRLQAAEVTV